MANLLYVLSERVPLNLLKIDDGLAFEDSLHISDIGLLNAFLIEVDSPLSEVVSSDKVSHIGVL